MGVTQNSYIPRAWEVSDVKVSGATCPRPLYQILPSHLVYNYYLNLSCEIHFMTIFNFQFSCLLVAYSELK